MARTAAGARMTRRHRVEQLAIRAAALRDLLRLWGTVEPTDLAATIGAFAGAAATVVRDGHQGSAEAAARYYTEFRAAEGVEGAVAVSVGAPPAPDVVAGLVRGAALAGLIGARRRGASLGAAARNGLVVTSGAAGRLVLAGGRQVVDEAIRSERRALGWMRVTDQDPCAWCAMLASRGPVFKSAETAAFDFRPDQFHDHDGCLVEPVFDEAARTDRALWPETSRRLRDRWDEVTAGLSGADARRAFRRSLEEGQ